MQALGQPNSLMERHLLQTGPRNVSVGPRVTLAGSRDPDIAPGLRNASRNAEHSLLLDPAPFSHGAHTGPWSTPESIDDLRFVQAK
jgi:hypothetical protein